MKAKAKPFRVVTPFGVRVIGTIRDGVLYKRVCKAKHFHREQGGWGMEVSALNELERLRVRQIVLEVTDEGILLRSSIEKYRHFGHHADYGWGAQVFLAEEHWDVIRSPFNRIIQLSLFDRRVAAK